MPIGWVKSLHCKSRAFDDVYHHHSNNGKLVLPSYSCRKIVRDVVDTRPGSVKKNPKPDPSLRRLCSSSRRPESESNPNHPTRRSVSARASSESGALPVLTDLPDGHPSRNVVEIIFQSSWSSDEFPGRVEMIFKVENGSRAVTRFEEYREAVKSRSRKELGSDDVDGGACDEDARCSADGNEMMRFFPMGPIPGGINGGAWVFPGGKGAAVCTFSGSGEAHASTGGGGGRRAMLICRVIAGRVAKKGEFGSDSVAGRAGELIVFDARAVLPCFLIFFRL
ncbi:PREDICTED: uncharacterized protein LOC104707536 [Camelina sativa]|uniref:Uncharacterized protein LOC104707536 n=1 Tax=Camelina sativa TaxID=90675 RepID=A0ABM0T7W8_CAMSA|nr:PREDICTED: uncharacterized protein LOC104707536 [Camelina sativa]